MEEASPPKMDVGFLRRMQERKLAARAAAAAGPSTSAAAAALSNNNNNQVWPYDDRRIQLGSYLPPGLLTTHISAGLNFLNRNCHPLLGLQNNCVGDSRDTLVEGYYPEEIFTSITALELLSDSLDLSVVDSLHNFIKPNTPSGIGLANFNKYDRLILDDVEDTGMVNYLRIRDGLASPNDPELGALLRTIICNVNESGIIETYIEPAGKRTRGNRLDPCCLLSALRLLYGVGVPTFEFQPTEDYLFQILASSVSASGGTSPHLKYYYPSADTFPYYCSKTVMLNQKAKLRFEQHLVRHVRERLGTSNYPLDLALRILTLDNLGLLGIGGSGGASVPLPGNSNSMAELAGKIELEIYKLKCQQQELSGAWPKDALFKKGKSDVFFGGKVISTIFGVAALQAYEKATNANYCC